jgi:hypothetical protein
MKKNDIRNLIIPEIPMLPDSGLLSATAAKKSKTPRRAFIIQKISESITKVFISTP